jgi:hypothetical protein
MHQKEKIIQKTGHPVAATLALEFLIKSEPLIQAVAKMMGRPYRSLLSAARDGMAMGHLMGPINKALNEAMHAAEVWAARYWQLVLRR